MELLKASDKYNIPRLKAVCEAELAKSLDIDKVFDILIASDMFKAVQLKDAAMHWAAKHAPELMKTKSWEDLNKEHTGLVKDVSEQFAEYIRALKYSDGVGCTSGAATS